ncbi:MAG: 4-hydroxy-tetrahydrodipicolinate synthase [Chitinophagales bacterium]
MKHPFSGLGVALITPFLPNKSIDFLALSKMLEHLITNEVDYIVALGTTGEAATLSKMESFQVFDFILNRVAGRKAVVAGLGGNNTAQLIELFSEYDYTKFDAILSASPAYNKPNQEGIFQHYSLLAKHSPIPIILYNVPGRTSSNITAQTTLRLAHTFENIVAIKEASGNMMQSMELVRDNKRKDFAILSGDDQLSLSQIAVGFSGVISVVGNAFPKQFGFVVRQALLGNFKTARYTHYQLLEMMNLLFADGNPAGVKAVLSELGLIQEIVRLPLVQVNKSVKAELVQEILKMNKYSAISIH